MASWIASWFTDRPLLARRPSVEGMWSISSRIWDKIGRDNCVVFGSYALAAYLAETAEAPTWKPEDVDIAISHREHRIPNDILHMFPDATDVQVKASLFHLRHFPPTIPLLKDNDKVREFVQEYHELAQFASSFPSWYEKSIEQGYTTKEAAMEMAAMHARHKDPIFNAKTKEEIWDEMAYREHRVGVMAAAMDNVLKPLTMDADPETALLTKMLLQENASWHPYPLVHWSVTFRLPGDPKKYQLVAVEHLCTDKHVGGKIHTNADAITKQLLLTMRGPGAVCAQVRNTVIGDVPVFAYKLTAETQACLDLLQLKAPLPEPVKRKYAERGWRRDD